MRKGCSVALLAVILVFPILIRSPMATSAESQSAVKTDLQVPAVQAQVAFPDLTFIEPIAIANAGDERLFVMEQAGYIWAVSGSGRKAEKALFLDFSDRVANSWEVGPASLAFHPQYAQNGTFYVMYETLQDEMLITRLSRFQVTADENRAAPASEKILFEVEQPSNIHNAGALQFDSSGMLVLSLGDGGPADDPFNRGQDPQSLLGKLLRIDVDQVNGDRNYGIPQDNPFSGQDFLEEIWALGLRNPWRFSFDTLTGDLYVADVGQNLWEEVNFVTASAVGGQNFGWRLKEGQHCFNPPQACDPGGLTDPIYEYSHAEGCAVIGGYVYRGSLVADLQGYYIFGDFCTGRVSGLVRSSEGKWQVWPLAKIDQHLSTFGLDNDGELYVASRFSGIIYRLVSSRQLLPIIIK